MSDFFRELEEDIREERIFILWRKYGNYVIGLAVAIVLATAGYALWKYMKHKSHLQAHVTLSSAVDLMKQGKKEDALKAFQALGKVSGGYGKLAQLYEAALTPNPETLYMKISQENIADPALGNLSKVLMASHAVDKQDILATLESLTAPNNAWAPLSYELLALGDLKRGDDVKAAERYVEILKDSHTTTNEQIRAGMMLSQIDLPPSFMEEKLKEEVQP